jgi:autotransporter translocation and assembly factor TamB
VLLPVCLMLWAGALYLIRVRLTAEQLLPLALRDYLRQTADLDVQIERIRLGWTRLQAWNLRAHLPDGTPLGESRYLSLNWASGIGRSLAIQLERPRLIIRRDTQGHWNIEPFLRRPPRRAAVQIPLELASTDGVLEFRDDFVRPTVVQTLRLREVQIRQPGSSMMVQAQAQSHDLGAIRLHALSDGDRWRVNLTVEHLRWAQVAPYLTKSLTEGDVEAQRAVPVVGDGETTLSVELLYAPNRPLRLVGTAQGVLRDVQYAQTPLPWRTLQFETQFTESSLLARLHAPDGSLSALGVIEGTARDGGQGSRRTVRYALAIQARGEDSSALERILNRIFGEQAQKLPLASGKRVGVRGQTHLEGEAPAEPTEAPLASDYTIQIEASGEWSLHRGWRDLIARMQAVGQVQVGQLRTPEGMLRQVQLPLLLKDGQVRLFGAQAAFGGGMLRADALISLIEREPRFQLAAHAKEIQLTQIPAMRKAKLSGIVDGQLVGEGTLKQPRLLANLLSNEVRYNGTRLGALRARLQYQRDTLEVPVASLHGAVGLLQASGAVKWNRSSSSDKPALSLQFSVDELDLNRVASLLGYREGVLGYYEGEDGRNRALRLDGIAYARGHLTGTLDKPLLQAQAAVFNGRLGDIGVELLALQARFQEGRIELPEITLYRRTAVAHARGVVELGSTPLSPSEGERVREKGQTLEGKPLTSREKRPLPFGETVGVRGSQNTSSSPSEGAQSHPRFELTGTITDFDLATLAEWGETPIKLAGLANLAFVASGTPEQFEITGELTTSKALIDQLRVDSASAQLQLTRQRDSTELRIDTAQAQLMEGVLSGQVQLSLNGQETRLQAEWQAQSVPLQLLAPYLPPEYRLNGRLDARGRAEGELDALQAETSWQIAQLNLNEVALGEASGTAYWAPDKTLILQARLDAPDGTIHIDELRYTPDRGEIAGQGMTEAIPIEWVRQLALALPFDLPPDLAERIDTLQGRLHTRWQLSGTTERPQLAVEGRASELALNETALGELQAQANWSQEQLDFQLRWQAETTRLDARGRWQRDALNAEMELSRFPLEWARLWEPSLPPVGGQLDLTMLASGDPSQPELTLSATVQNLSLPMPNLTSQASPIGASEADTVAESPSFVIDQLLFSRIDVREGAIATDDALIQVRGYRARLSGQLPFHWSPLQIARDEPLSVQLALREQPLRVLELFLPIDSERTNGTVNAALTIGGTLNALQPRGELQIANGSLAFEQVSTYLQELGLQVEFDGQRARIVQARARSSAGGTVRLTGEVEVAQEEPTLALQGTLERFTVNEPRLPIGGSAFGRVDGEVALQGTLKRPQLTAYLQVHDGFLSLPAEIETTTGEFALPFNPELNVQIQVARGFTLRNPNLDARMEGNLQIAGMLSEPRATGTFSLQGGALNLPTARLRLEPDSLILFSYPYTTPEGEKIARLDLNVRATTSVVAIDYTGYPQRYRVELDIRGPLDDPERFQMVARSDPPGLSEPRILSLLGRGGVLESLARGGDPVQIFRQQLGEIVTGQVLPGLLSPLETGIAEALGLEQFALDYTGGIAPSSIYLVKELFDGFGISYRRSLSLTNPQYEVRLFYRLPFRNRFLQRLKLGWGFDKAQRQFLFVEGSLLFK